MKLSKRLKAIANLIPSNSNIIDIGADHALLDIYLTKEKNCQCLATDISAKCIEKANKNIQKYQVNVTTMVTDGLKNIPLHQEIIVMSGMGTYTILKILNQKITNDLIISSQNDIPYLRKALKKKGYYLYQEQIVKDKHFYVITYYKYKTGSKIKNLYNFSNDEYRNKLIKEYKLKYQNEKNLFYKFKYLHIMRQIKKGS